MLSLKKIAITGLSALALGLSANVDVAPLFSPITNSSQAYSAEIEPLVEIFQMPGLEGIVQGSQTAGNMMYRIGVPGVSKNNEQMCAVQPDKVAYLSFDDGGYYYWDTLKILNERNAKATFCLVGQFMENNPDFVRAAVGTGHRICNHTYTHAHLPLLTNEQIAWELNRADAAFDSIVNPYTSGDTTKPWMRLPFGEGKKDTRVISVVNGIGYYSILWNIDADSHKIIGADAIKKNVIPNVKNGSIVLFHMIDPELLQALPDIIEDLSCQGYELVNFDGK